MSGFVREQNAARVVPRFTPDLVKTVERLAIPRLPDRAMRLLAFLVRNLGFNTKNQYALKHDPASLAVSYSANIDDLEVLCQILASKGFLMPSGGGGWTLTPAGCIAAEEFTQPPSRSAQGFVAMWFDRSMDENYTLGFDPAIRAAGYAPLRIDVEEHAGSISDAIQSEIRRSRFVVADYTGANNGVYFEAGFAIGLGVPVIATCRTGDMDSLHFDIRHINTLVWDHPADLKLKLARRLSAVLGDGPLPKPS